MRSRSFIVIVMVFAGLLSLNSCTKKYTCQCVIKYSGMPGLPDSSVNEYDITDKQSQAKSKCQAESFEHEANGIKTTETCALY